MSINIGPPAADELRPRITVIGVGGAGGNAIGNMIEAEIEGVDFIVANTDAQALNNSVATNRIQLGPEITRGLGAGSRPEVGRAAAEETVAEIERALEGVNMVFIAAGMGGGTGTGAAPVIAEVARSKGILTVGVVTKPFLFEGTRRMRAAEAGIEELQKHVDTLIVIPNQNLFLVAKPDTTFKQAFKMADEVLQQGVRSITDLMVMPGLINLDFADIRSVMNEMGKAMMGTGEAEGANRALAAAERAIANPLLDGVSMHGAKGVIISIIGGDDMTLMEIDEAANHIRELVDPEANIIWGSAYNPELTGRIRISVVATGIDAQPGDGRGAVAVPRPLDLAMGRGGLKLPPATAMPTVAVERQPEPAPSLPLAGEPSEGAATPQAAAPPEPALQPQTPPAQAAASPAAPGWAGLDPFDSSEGRGHDREVGGPAAPPGRPAPDEDLAEFGEIDEVEPLELDDPVEAEPQLPGEGDGLLREADRLVDADEEVQPGLRRRRLIGSDFLKDEDAGDPVVRKPAGLGGTLFERMASRVAPPDEDGDDDEGDGREGAIRIPRFLNRQNNQ